MSKLILIGRVFLLTLRYFASGEKSNVALARLDRSSRRCLRGRFRLTSSCDQRFCGQVLHSAAGLTCTSNVTMAKGNILLVAIMRVPFVSVFATPMAKSNSDSPEDEQRNGRGTVIEGIFHIISVTTCLKPLPPGVSVPWQDGSLKSDAVMGAGDAEVKVSTMESSIRPPQ